MLEIQLWHCFVFRICELPYFYKGTIKSAFIVC